MKVTRKQLIGTGLGLAAGFIIGRNLNVCLRTLKTIDAKMASSLKPIDDSVASCARILKNVFPTGTQIFLPSVRYVVYSFSFLAIVGVLARSIELESDFEPPYDM